MEELLYIKVGNKEYYTPKKNLNSIEFGILNISNEIKYSINLIIGGTYISIFYSPDKESYEKVKSSILKHLNKEYSIENAEIG